MLETYQQVLANFRHAKFFEFWFWVKQAYDTNTTDFR